MNAACLSCKHMCECALAGCYGAESAAVVVVRGLVCSAFWRTRWGARLGVVLVAVESARLAGVREADDCLDDGLLRRGEQRRAPSCAGSYTQVSGVAAPAGCCGSKVASAGRPTDIAAYPAVTTGLGPAAAASPASSCASAAAVLGQAGRPRGPRALAGTVAATAVAGCLAAHAILTARMQGRALAALAGFKGKVAANKARRRPARQHQGERVPAALANAAQHAAAVWPRRCRAGWTERCGACDRKLCAGTAVAGVARWRRVQARRQGRGRCCAVQPAGRCDHTQRQGCKCRTASKLRVLAAAATRRAEWRAGGLQALCRLHEGGSSGGSCS